MIYIKRVYIMLKLWAYLLSTSARRLWIEIRNLHADQCCQQVNLCEEVVDRNNCLYARNLPQKSQPLRGGYGLKYL